MVNSYDDMMGDETDPQDHSAHNMPQATQHYAGDVLPMPGDKSMGGGHTPAAADYATGRATDPKVLPIGNAALSNWYKSKTK